MSTTKSPSSTYAQSFGKKSFIQRLFGFARFSNTGSARASSDDGKLHRRHSLGPSRNMDEEQRQYRTNSNCSAGHRSRAPLTVTGLGSGVCGPNDDENSGIINLH